MPGAWNWRQALGGCSGPLLRTCRGDSGRWQWQGNVVDPRGSAPKGAAALRQGVRRGWRCLNHADWRAVGLGQAMRRSSGTSSLTSSPANRQVPLPRDMALVYLVVYTHQWPASLTARSLDCDSAVRWYSWWLVLESSHSGSAEVGLLLDHLGAPLVS